MQDDPEADKLKRMLDVSRKAFDAGKSSHEALKLMRAEFEDTEPTNGANPPSSNAERPPADG